MQDISHKRPFRSTYWLATSLVAIIVSMPCWAEIMRPYKATYSTEWQFGLRLSGKAERSLKQDEQGHWQLRTEGSAMLANLTEISHFKLQQQQLVPLKYSYHRQIFNKTRHVKLIFDWQKSQVMNQLNDQNWRMKIVPGTYDKQIVQLQLRRDLLAQRPNLSYTVADGGKLKVFSYQIEAEETIATPLGKHRSIRVKRDRGGDNTRNTWIWFAPEHNFIVVRIEQQEANGKHYQLKLQQLTWLD